MQFHFNEFALIPKALCPSLMEARKAHFRLHRNETYCTDSFPRAALTRCKSLQKRVTCAGLIAEINNGRLAMLGIMGFIAEAKIPGAVPALQGLIPAYKGEVLRAAQMIIRLLFRENFFFTAFLACEKSVTLGALLATVSLGGVADFW